MPTVSRMTNGRRIVTERPAWREHSEHSRREPMTTLDYGTCESCGAKIDSLARCRCFRD